MRSTLTPLGLLLSLLLPAPRLQAQTLPLQTEEATTRPAGTVALETGFDYIADRPNFENGLPRDVWAGPLLRVVYSPADPVEIDLEWVARVGQVKDVDYGSSSDWGDVSLRAKTRLVSSPLGAFSARFWVTLPETSYGLGLGPNVLRMGAQGLLTRAFRGTRVHANAGLMIHDEVYRPHEQRDFLAWGLALEQRLGSAVALVAEGAGREGRGLPGADARAEARLGLRLGRGRTLASLAVRRGLTDTDGTWGGTAGVQFLLGPR